MELTLSVIKADVGGYVGHSSSHPDLIQKAKENLENAQGQGLLIDYYITVCGDDLQLIMTHQQGEDSEQIHKLAYDTFAECTNVAKSLKLHGAGQDLLADAFSGTVKGMEPGTTEMQFFECQAETIVIFMADKTASGAWNLPLYKIFADPFNTIGLVIASNMHSGFTFEVHDVKEHKKIIFNAPKEIYDMLIFFGAPSRYAIKAVYYKESGEINAVSSTQRLSLMAGRYIGKDDPVCIIRSQGKFPAVGEILELLPEIIQIEKFAKRLGHPSSEDTIIEKESIGYIETTLEMLSKKGYIVDSGNIGFALGERGENVWGKIEFKPQENVFEKILKRFSVQFKFNLSDFTRKLTIWM